MWGSFCSALPYLAHISVLFGLGERTTIRLDLVTALLHGVVCLQCALVGVVCYRAILLVFER